MKDSKLVMFYTNDLAHTPSEDILDDTSEEAVCCVNGLGPLHRWVGTEVLNRSILHVPAPIVAYNMFMNSVDIMDQRRSTNPTRRNEKRLSMTIFTLILDLAVHNAFAMYGWLCEVRNISDEEISYCEFKRRIAVDLVAFHLSVIESRQEKQRISDGVPPLDGRMDEIIGEDVSMHLLLPTLEKKRIQCYLCKILDNSKQRKDHYCCTTCRVGFHPECFTAFHHQDALAVHRKTLYRLIKAGDGGDNGHRNKKQKYISSINDLKLPCV